MVTVARTQSANCLGGSLGLSSASASAFVPIANEGASSAALTSASGAAAVPASGASDALGDAEDGPLAGALVDEASHDEAVATGLKSEL